MLDLDKYFKQQAALAERKRKLKKTSNTPNKDSSLSIKKTKLLNTDAKTNKRCQKSKHENSKDNILQSTNKADSNVTNEIADNSSESEYVPSDNELDSGNINIQYVSINSKEIYLTRNLF